MKQYTAIKRKYPGALLLFRVGDFYETFGEDAIKASRALDITLTKRGNGSASEIELAGFPHHALDLYLPKLVRSGYRVAICDQLEDPRWAKGVVKRGVTELVTPGVALNDQVLEKRQNNFLAAIHKGKKLFGIAFLDISTGEFYATEGTEEHVYKLIQNFKPAEIIFSKSLRSLFDNQFSNDYAVFALDEWVFTFDYGYEKMRQHFQTANLKGFGINELNEAITAAGSALHYLEATEHKNIHHIASVSRIDEDKYMWLDKFTVRNLEIINAQQEGGVPLIHVLDKTITPMGSRQMRKWVVFPLKDKIAIKERLDIVEVFYQKQDLAEKIIAQLHYMADLERLASKVAVQRINPRELLQLKKSLQAILPIQKLLIHQPSLHLTKRGNQLDSCAFLVNKLEAELCEDAPPLLHQGRIIKKGVDTELDELRTIAFSGKDKLVQIRDREAQKTGISSLKISFNKVFGYYLEVSNTHKAKVPAAWIRKQTLVNAERYITEELKTYEEKILHAEEKRLEIEQKRFKQLVHHVADFIAQIQQNARHIAVLDCLLSFAAIAHANDYVNPQIDETTALYIEAGRHPVIEMQLPSEESYVPNDVYLNSDTQQILIITGPNMAGKSALLRQTALIVLMAQIGSFVPAKSAQLGIVDKIFTRVGAADNLARGESTFMVEMTETASILNNLSRRSLILMDEIGRGTSTYDGVSIAWAIVEYLHHNEGYRPKTLFATHYHELNQLAEDLSRVKNYNVAVKEIGEKIIFLRKLKEGGSEHSFGIHVARLAGIPGEIVERANEILHFLEKDKKKGGNEKKIKLSPSQGSQTTLFQNDPEMKRVAEILSKIDITATSPVEALLKLNEILSLLPKKPNQ